MIKWISKTLGLTGFILLLTYLCIYVPDYLSYEPWAPEFTDVNGSPLALPCEVSTKKLVFLMWTRPDCPYCYKQIDSLYAFMNAQSVSTNDFDIILVYEIMPDELPDNIQSNVIIILGQPRSAVPYTEFWINRDGWVKYVGWLGYKDVDAINQLFTEISNENQ